MTTIEGLADGAAWGQTFADHGGSQCGFCTPGIIMRAAALTDEQRGRPEAVQAGDARPPVPVHRMADGRRVGRRRSACRPQRRSIRRRAVPGPDSRAARRRSVGPQVALGQGGFADDRAPADALVALRRADGEWVVGETLAEAGR